MSLARPWRKPTMKSKQWNLSLRRFSKLSRVKRRSSKKGSEERNLISKQSINATYQHAARYTHQPHRLHATQSWSMSTQSSSHHHTTTKFHHHQTCVLPQRVKTALKASQTAFPWKKKKTRTSMGMRGTCQNTTPTTMRTAQIQMKIETPSKY